MLYNFVVSRTVCFLDLGSNDGHVRLWKCGENFRSLELCFTVPLVRHMILFKAYCLKTGTWGVGKGLL